MIMRPVRNAAKAIIIKDNALLAVKYEDEGGVYFALPGGGQLHGETIVEAIHREIQEELEIAVRNHGLRFIREYIGKYGESAWRDAGFHQVEFIFECEIEGDTEPRMGTHGDHSQVGIAWIPLDELDQVRFYPRKLIAYLGKPFPQEIEYWGSVD
jgi:8-oxo-dGTP diphosphatase